MSARAFATMVSSRELSQSCELIFPAMDIHLPNSCVYSNLGDFNPQFADHVLNEAYKERTARSDAIYLSNLPDDTVLYGGSFMASAGGALVEDQVLPGLRGSLEACNQTVAAGRQIESIDAECVLLSRYGDGTWGHWVAELLPRAVLAEYVRPGKFKFLISDRLLRRTEQRGFADAALESLAAYGINEDRLIPIRPDCNYRLLKSHAVSPIWTDCILHREAVDLIRSKLHKVGFRKGAPRIAVIRESPNRMISNMTEVASYLSGYGFRFVNAVKLAFLEQVAVFRSASTVFGILGSDLTGLIYSPDHVAVVAAAPGDWGDRFFYGLVQLRDGRYAEARGPILTTRVGLYRDACFSLGIDCLHQAVIALESTSP